MKIVKIIFLFICLSGFSQTKVGTINVDFILSYMPELTQVQTELDTYGNQLDVDLNKKITAYKSIVDEFSKNQTTYTDAVKKEKQQAIITAEMDINKFRQNGTQLISLKQEDLLRPLYQKIGTALEAVAQSQGYTQVLQINETVAYFDLNHDLTAAVLTELDITIPEEKE